MRINLFGLIILLIYLAFTIKKESKITIFMIGDFTMADLIYNLDSNLSQEKFKSLFMLIPKGKYK